MLHLIGRFGDTEFQKYSLSRWENFTVFYSMAASRTKENVVAKDKQQIIVKFDLIVVLAEF